MKIEMPQIVEPSLSQKRLPNQFTNKNIKDNAEASLTRPNKPVRRRQDETDVNPADGKIVGASKVCQAGVA